MMRVGTGRVTEAGTARWGLRPSPPGVALGTIHVSFNQMASDFQERTEQMLKRA